MSTNLSPSEVRRVLPVARRRGVSEVARGPAGFAAVFLRAGSFAALPDYWRKKQAGFVARHMAQARSPESLWDAKGQPSRRHIALMVWGYTPTPARTKTWLRSLGSGATAGLDFGIFSP